MSLDHREQALTLTGRTSEYHVLMRDTFGDTLTDGISRVNTSKVTL